MIFIVIYKTVVEENKSMLSIPNETCCVLFLNKTHKTIIFSTTFHLSITNKKLIYKHINTEFG